MWKTCLFASNIKSIFFLPPFLPWMCEGGRRHSHLLLWDAEWARAQHSGQSHVGLCLHCPSPGIPGGESRGELQLPLPPACQNTFQTHGNVLPAWQFEMETSSDCFGQWDKMAMKGTWVWDVEIHVDGLAFMETVFIKYVLPISWGHFSISCCLWVRISL